MSVLKSATKAPWICFSCLKQRRKSLVRQRRYLAGLAAAFASPSPKLHSKTDDDTLRQVFDSEPFWKQFNNPSSFQTSPKKAGLLQNKYLTSPKGFAHFAEDSQKKCNKLAEKIVNASTNEEYKSFARVFDRLSDQLCRIIDSVEFVRNVHPDAKIQAAATEAHGAMYEYMNVLNTHKGLEEQLRKAAGIPEVWNSWSEEEKTTVNILLRDFSHSAISQPEDVRKRFIEVSNDIEQAGTELLNYMEPEKRNIKLSSSELKGLDPQTAAKVTKLGQGSLPTVGGIANLALKSLQDPEIRRELYTANRTSSKSSVERVERLLRKRAELAKICGYDSAAHMNLTDKMSRTPEAINRFLEAIAAVNKPHVEKDLSALRNLKNSDSSSQNTSQALNAWDIPYYRSRLRAQLHPLNRPPDILSSYFSLGTVMQGLSNVFSRLYGIRLVPRESTRGEIWNEDVRRLDVLDENEGLIAVLYCDLFRRANKSPNPAHFTLRCSREITGDEIAEGSSSLPPNPDTDDLSNIMNDGMALTRDPLTGNLNQLPVVAFICDFARPSYSGQPTLLRFSDVCTLFHEMGHAVHSMLGRTKLQNVAGTRCATDFAELPSILMEYFAASPEVLKSYARHWETNKPLNVDILQQEIQTNRQLLSAQETEAQILFAALDQRYHSSEVPPYNSSESWNSTEVYQQIYSHPLFSSIPEPPGTAWQGFFGHLFGYGAVYYAYLFDRAIAGKVWQSVFANGTLERANGQRFRDEVLSWGGARDPWHCVAGVLGEEYSWLSEGGEQAMIEVGKWGAGEEGAAGAP